MQIKLKHEKARYNNVYGMGMLNCSIVHKNHTEKTNMSCKTCIYVKHMQNSQKCTKQKTKVTKSFPTLKINIVLNVKIKANKI